MNQVDQVTAPHNTLVSPEEQLEILSLTDDQFASGVGNLIKHMLSTRSRKNIYNNGNIVTGGGTSLDAILAENGDQLLQE